MNALTPPADLAPDTVSGDTILPDALPMALDLVPGARILSLDCFDTLLWRDTHAPQGIFGLLPDITTMQRRAGEMMARRHAAFGAGRFDVSIAEIYAQVYPNAAPMERQAAIAAELAAEARHCYAFAPTVALMREAKARGLQVIIVSDTYLDSTQLRELIARSAGEDVAALIDWLFCSCTYGKGKSGGLYGDVLPKLKARPHEILHIGDNRSADVDGVGRFGVNTLHLAQFTPAVEEQLRLEASVSAMIHHQDRKQAAAAQPHRAALAFSEPRVSEPAERFGLTVLGPIMQGFEHWLRAEADALQSKHGGKVHWLFLMRDGYLPRMVHAAAGPGGEGHAIEISRFTANAASFSHGREIEQYVVMNLGVAPDTLARQLLLPEAEIIRITANRTPQEGSQQLLNEVRRAKCQRAILDASRAMAKRLVAHVVRAANPAPGDTLMLVDLGYNGTVQNRIEGVLKKALKAHVAGRYLLLREVDRPGLDKRGFIDGEHYDANTLEAMCGNVAVLEQLCATTMGSVANYTDAGEPIRRENDIKQRQSAIRDKVQAGCLRFVTDSAGLVTRADTSGDLALWRQGAAATMARLMYLPVERELAVVDSFEHDINFGSSRTIPLFDIETAERGLRQRGLFYMKGVSRMYLPGDLGLQGIAPKLTLFANLRYGLRLNRVDFTGKGMMLPVVFAAGDEVRVEQIEAQPTHDGYYLAAIPIGDCRYSVAIQFGECFEWLELDSISVLPTARLFSEEFLTTSAHTNVTAILSGIEAAAPRLLHCTARTAFALVNPPEREDDRKMVVAAVFRPIVRREIAPTQPA